jgi:hypothetical protein
MRFSWTALILAPLLVPMLFGAAMLNLEGGNPLLSFVFATLMASIISYGATIFLLLPSLYLLSLWRPMTVFQASLLGAGLGALVVVPMTLMMWKSSGPDSGPPTESFLTFFVRFGLDPFTLICPAAGLVTSGLYWWLATRRREPAPRRAS